MSKLKLRCNECGRHFTCNVKRNPDGACPNCGSCDFDLTAEPTLTPCFIGTCEICQAPVYFPHVSTAAHPILCAEHKLWLAEHDEMVANGLTTLSESD